MQINNSTTPSSSLYHDALFKLGIDRTDTITFPISDFMRSANSWYKRVNSWIWQVTGEWEYDVSNYADLPIATTDLIENRQDYQIPSYAQKIDRVEVKNINGDWIKLIPFDKSQIDSSITEFCETPGMPRFYDVLGRSLMLYPTASSGECDTITDNKGLKLYFSREINEFTTTDTTASPGFSEDFHEIISVGAAIDFSELIGDKDRTEGLNNRLSALKVDLKQFYGSNQREMKPNIRPNYIRHK
jgi:hypothetical protein